jgi:uncharacterized protein YdeI (YjbR/CyaY-like superfamily)
MSSANPLTDQYINSAAPFAQPVLKHLRQLVHQANPDITESIKWQFVAFDYKKSILCSMAAFKSHCAFGFWLAEKMDDPDGILGLERGAGMGQLGKITSVEDLPPDDVMIKYIQAAIALVDAGVKMSRSKIETKPVPQIPETMKIALAKNPTAQLNFENFTQSKQREYIEWITEAKTESTQLKRLDTAIEWISEGKSKNWKYEKK